jgi:hypothetical protein
VPPLKAYASATSGVSSTVVPAWLLVTVPTPAMPPGEVDVIVRVTPLPGLKLR